MPRSKNYYEILGVDSKADLSVVKKAYVKKARLLHPDNYPDLTKSELATREKQMKDLNGAWSVISNPEKRQKYDASLTLRASEDQLLQTSRRTSEKFVVEDEPLHMKTNQIASREEMEIRGFARLMKPVPLFCLIVLIVGTIIVGFVFGGTGNPQNLKSTFVPESGDFSPKLCIDIAPVEEVPCNGREDASVWEIISANEKCSAGLSFEYRSQIGGGYCVTYRTKSLP